MSFVEALFKRYSDPLRDDRSNGSFQIFIVGSLSPGKSGNQLILPPSLSLNGCNIKYSGSERKIRELCANVEQLDLASNGFTGLDEIFRIVKGMPNLRFLNLSENDLSDCKINPHEPCELINMRSLVLNNTSVPFAAVQLLLDSMPNLCDLHLSLNNYTTLDIGPTKYNNIRRLYISGNPNLKSWFEISNLLDAFPSLEGLTMADCNVETIPEDLGNILPKLQTLNISNWPIKEWELLERLNNLTHLTELRCQGIQVLQAINNPDCKRQHLIARLPNIQRLNGSEISDDERLFAEKAFVRWFLANTDANKPERFYTLFDIYGKVDPLAEVDLSPPKYATIKIICTFYDTNCLPSDEDVKKEIKEMKVDLNKSVKDFKSEISSIFNLPIGKMRIFYIDHVLSEVMGPEELKFNQKKLYTYNVQDGDEFLIDQKSN
ncbi:tubulin-specific chaperone cofactor E-like protein [Tetranychus urticae]|uniref:Ubiquitin-like domain-containing protein n=1 Tax=Tetranychus urticae TaxID=32264 RepID=T1KLM1_TETUR|nr:tubulin-specific chaperone cofactor E-like protein [Tetranychus urticae]